jgi:probable phosphoglycerate mutase
MSGRWKIKHPSMRPLALAAREILPPENVSYVWVPRERNKHADRLANEALDAAARGQPWSASTSTAELDTGGGAVVDEAEVEPPPDVPSNALVGWDASLGAPTTLVLLRHGETAHTVEQRFSGAGGADPPLTAHGLDQARAAAALLGRGHRDQAVDAVVSSPLRRARQTADEAAAALGLQVRVADDVRECAFGEWEGHTFAEVRAGWPRQLSAWLADPAEAPPGGESFEAVRRRVERARDRLLARYPGRRVLVVTHVNPVKLLVRAALGAPLTAVYRMELSPASLTEIQWYAGGTASLRRFNEAAHLASAVGADAPDDPGG